MRGCRRLSRELSSYDACIGRTCMEVCVLAIVNTRAQAKGSTDKRFYSLN